MVRAHSSATRCSHLASVIDDVLVILEEIFKRRNFSVGESLSRGQLRYFRMDNRNCSSFRELEVSGFLEWTMEQRFVQIRFEKSQRALITFADQLTSKTCLWLVVFCEYSVCSIDHFYEMYLTWNEFCPNNS